ncbi:hypothetical protein, partial [Methylobacter sp.]|uniref:hypothetical protein n=1 Tax=Methylobacter sp. TaxID=2051955 RepID=UPI002FDDD1AA
YRNALSRHTCLRKPTLVSLDQLPHLPRCYPTLFQKVAHHIVADIVQMLGQVETSVVDRRANQVFYVTVFRNHTC